MELLQIHVLEGVISFPPEITLYCPFHQLYFYIEYVIIIIAKTWISIFSSSLVISTFDHLTSIFSWSLKIPFFLISECHFPFDLWISVFPLITEDPLPLDLWISIFSWTLNISLPLISKNPFHFDLWISISVDLWKFLSFCLWISLFPWSL